MKNSTDFRWQAIALSVVQANKRSLNSLKRIWKEMLSFSVPHWHCFCIYCLVSICKFFRQGKKSQWNECRYDYGRSPDGHRQGQVRYIEKNCTRFPNSNTFSSIFLSLAEITSTTSSMMTVVKNAVAIVRAAGRDTTNAMEIIKHFKHFLTIYYIWHWTIEKQTTYKEN